VHTVTALSILHLNAVLQTRYKNFTDCAAAQAHIKAIDYPVVVKASGLAAGKGVILPTTQAEALAAVEAVMVKREFGDAGAEVTAKCNYLNIC
jgi:phosphoribosylamine-glycine ligase